MFEYLMVNPALIEVLIGALITDGFSLLGLITKSIFEVYKSRSTEKKVKLANFSRDLVDAYYYTTSHSGESIDFKEGLCQLLLLK